MATNRPWMSWYPADVLTDEKVLGLSPLAELAYRRLLDYCWLQNASLPNNVRVLAGMARLPEEEFEKAWVLIMDENEPCFVPHPENPERLTNKRLLREWQKAAEAGEQARENGKKGGRPPKAQTAGKTGKKTSGVSEQKGLGFTEKPNSNPDQSYPHPHPQLHPDIKKEKEPPTPNGKNPARMAKAKARRKVWFEKLKSEYPQHRANAQPSWAKAAFADLMKDQALGSTDGQRFACLWRALKAAKLHADFAKEGYAYAPGLGNYLRGVWRTWQPGPRSAQDNPLLKEILE